VNRRDEAIHVGDGEVLVDAAIGRIRRESQERIAPPFLGVVARQKQRREIVEKQ
jgi:hypothetical protein